MAKAIIKHSYIKKLVGIEMPIEFFYTLQADNGQVLAHSETYTRKHNCLKVIARYFPNFEVVDKTKK